MKVCTVMDHNGNLRFSVKEIADGIELREDIKECF